MDALPLWFWLPTSIAAWVGFLVLEVRAAEPDPYDELTPLDVLEKTGTYPHG